MQIRLLNQSQLAMSMHKPTGSQSEEFFWALFIDSCFKNKEEETKLFLLFQAIEQLGEEQEKKWLKFKDATDGDTVFHVTAKFGLVKNFKTLARRAEKYGKDFESEIINIMNKRKQTPIYCVCLKGYNSFTESNSSLPRRRREKIIKKCIEMKANINVMNEITKMTALHWAAFNKDK